METRPAKRNPEPLNPTFHGCQWIEGDALDRNFCGRRTMIGTAWCPQHYVRVYRVAARREEELLS